MNLRSRCSFLLLFLGLILAPTLSLAAEVYLNANFNDETIDQPVGRRGASYGEPVWVDAAAEGFVRGAPMPTPSLELVDGSSSSSCTARFSLLDGAMIASGFVVITANLWFAEMPGETPCRFYVYDDGYGVIFVDLSFAADGTVHVADMNGAFGEAGQYTTGRVYPVAILVDMTGHTYDVWLDSQIVRDDVPINITNQTVNTIACSLGNDADLIGRFFVDDLYVTNDPAAVTVERMSWGRVRGLFGR